MFASTHHHNFTPFNRRQFLQVNCPTISCGTVVCPVPIIYSLKSSSHPTTERGEVVVKAASDSLPFFLPLSFSLFLPLTFPSFLPFLRSSSTPCIGTSLASTSFMSTPNQRTCQPPKTSALSSSLRPSLLQSPPTRTTGWVPRGRVTRECQGRVTIEGVPG